uniref:Uncharacterized protein n=1 Tax=Corethron hystrix TaxID=216773 RepID=A0A7S1BBZ7_9STRA|mmetsp:Transcript_19526/g.44444  ORF Transcript_19526/g.44444 Transcript_19526/m.44444 type:complete len:331 (+) Transcript_19526:432-1424(+)
MTLTSRPVRNRMLQEKYFLRGIRITRVYLTFFSWAPGIFDDNANNDSFLVAGTKTFFSMISSDERCPANPMTHIGVLSETYLLEIDDTNTTLHCACILHYPAGEILKIMEDNPEMASIKNKSGEYPLHYACLDEKGVDHRVFNKLVELNPDAVKTGNCERSFPLHLQCMVGVPSAHVVKELLKVYPHACAIQSEFKTKYEGKEINKFKEETEEEDWFCNMWKEECWVPSIIMNNKPHRYKIQLQPHIEQGWCPLHLAIIGGAHGESIRSIYDTRPAGYKLKTSRGRTPYMCLDLATSVHPSTSVLLNKIEIMQEKKRKRKEKKELEVTNE